jgi:signal transduction histidine kinase
VDAAAFRVIQEALTNVIRHAGATNASVSIHYGDGGVAVEIEDDGAGAAEPSSQGGSGIAGMRDRVAALGGQFEAGALPGRGFRVRALLPLEEAT